MQPAAPAPCRAGGYGQEIAPSKKRGRRRAPSHSGMCAAWPRQLAARRVWRKTKHWQPAFLAFWDGKAPCLAAPGHVTQAAMNREMTKMAANEKRGRRRDPVPQRDVRGLGAAACRPPNPRKTKHWQPAFLAFWDGKRLVWLRRSHVAQAAMNREMTKMAANEKRGRRRDPVPQRDVRGLGAAACRPNSCQ